MSCSDTGRTPRVQRPDCVKVENYPPVPLCELCAQCRSIFENQPVFSRVSPHDDSYRSAVCGHHQTEDVLREAASACVICQLLLESFTAMTIHDAQGEHRVSLADGLCCWVRLSSSADIALTFFATSVGKWEASSPSALIRLDPVSWSISELDEQMPAEALISRTTGSHRSLELAKHWLQKCEQHSVCRHPVPGSDSVPGRRILIWKDDRKLKARVCWKPPIATKYATLSHRWGRVPAVRLLLSNARELFEEIPIPRLEQVFQDAISVTWELGLRYLWIDTLCIFQDSPWDWTAQSRNMGAIYMNAACNIAAASPSSGGLFSTRDPFLHFSPHLFLDWNDIDLCQTGKPEPLRGFYTLRDSAGWSANVTKAGLNQRGWVSQERELSPCILTFTPRQVYWRCGELHACESFPNGIPGTETYHITYTTRSFRDLLKENAPPDEVVRFWYGFVSRYSATVLTQKRDRIPAAFGMAQALSGLMPENVFLAGLWESHLAESLLWRTRELDDPGRVTVLADFQLPSWSWASLDCRVVCDAHKIWGDSRLVATVVEDGVTMLSEDDTEHSPFVLCNRLRITGQLSGLTDTLSRATNADGIHPFKLHPDIPDPTVLASQFANLPEQPVLAQHDKIQVRKISRQTLLLPILVFDHFNTVMGLLVNPLEAGGQVFSRAGTFEVSLPDKSEPRHVFRLLSGTGGELESEEKVETEKVFHLL
ncbi:heterokaryon incompatibility protein-domain-containing protein [Podospora aff. communis PSN243]|uniref:Heterokaryon incompatibility protein-domain-containing protein n=1 Tax=Podospora aff. communis PSN243 TaxID=3040156 RepID=A0AAV9G6V6_9PEZI|nr:heterokaryon incompatibility protein-domain-containing protein [Podospora aff. communis PSN243]